MKIIIVDDHQVVRDGFRHLLAALPDGKSRQRVDIIDVPTYEKALVFVDGEPDIDLILLDFQLPDVNGYSALIDLQERHPDIPVVVISGRDDPRLVREAIDRGAAGFIPKSSSSATILGALRLVLSGGVYLPREALEFAFPLTGPVHTGLMGAETTATDHHVVRAGGQRLGLTRRQCDVLQCILDGMPNKTISRELCLSEGTVKNHVAVILRTLNVPSRVQAIIVARGMGLLRPVT